MITVILPIWNERAALPRVLEELLSTPGLANAHVLAMDDGSTDGTAGQLDSFAAREKRLQVVHLPHGGKDRALWRAFAEASTEWVCVMDADGQYDPADIPRLLKHAVDTGASGVWGIRAAREDNAWRKLTSRLGRLAKRLILGDSAIRDSGCGLLVAKRALCQLAAAACPEPAGQVHCHLADVIKASGGTVGEIAITHRSRAAGEAKYGMMNRVIPGLRSLVQARRMKKRLGAGDC